MCRSEKSDAYKAFNQTISDFIEDKVPVDHIVKHIDGSKDVIHPSFINTATAVVKGVVSSRLRERATEAIHSGKKKVSIEHIDRLKKSLSDAKACGYLEDDVDLSEFEVFLNNLEVRAKAADSGNPSSASWLCQQIQIHAVPPEKETPASEMTITVVCAALLKALQRDPTVTLKALARHSALDNLRKILLGDPKSLKDSGPQYPELQVVIAMLLAEIALTHANEAYKKQQNQRILMPMGSSSRLAAFRGSVGGTGGDAQLCLDILLAGLRSGVQRSEHSLVWAVLKAIRHTSENIKNKQHLLMEGIIPLLKRTMEFYQAADTRLPDPQPRPTATLVDHSGSPPVFHGHEKTSALGRTDVTVKDRWLQHSQSLPGIMPRGQRPCIDWLAGSPMAAARRSPARRTKTSRFQMLPDVHQGHAFDLMGGDQSQPLLGQSSSSSMLKPSAGTVTAQGASKTFPNLMWLIAEDGVDTDDYYRCLDKGLMLLLVRKLLVDMEKSASELAAPFSNVAARSRAAVAAAASKAFLEEELAKDKATASGKLGQPVIAESPAAATPQARATPITPFGTMGMGPGDFYTSSASTQLTDGEVTMGKTLRKSSKTVTMGNTVRIGAVVA